MLSMRSYWHGLPGVETVAVAWPLAATWKPPESWRYARDGMRETWTLPNAERPPGVSKVMVTDMGEHAPRGADPYFVRYEGNLTTALCGPGSAGGSLHGEDVPAASAALMQLVADLVPGGLWDRPYMARHRRMDPSVTWRVPDDAFADALVGIAQAANRRDLPTHSKRKNRKAQRWRAEYGSNSETAIRHPSKGMSCTVYNGGVVHDCEPSMRVEARILFQYAALNPEDYPVPAHSDRLKWLPSGLLTTADVANAARPVLDMLHAMDRMAAAQGDARARSLLAAGCPTVGSALRLSMVQTMLDGGGQAGLLALFAQKGLDGSRQVERWVKELRAYDDALLALPDGQIGSLMDAVRAGSALYANPLTDSVSRALPASVA